MRLGEPGQAKEQLERALDRAPDHAGAQYQLGLAYVALGDSAHARTHLLRAGALDPRLPGAHRALSHLALAKSDWEGALAELRLERAAAPESARTHYELGRWFAQHGGATGPDSALSAFSQAIARDPGLVDAHVERARTLDALGRSADAAAAWGEAAGRDTARADLAAALGVSLFRAERFADAAPAFARAVRLDPHDAKSAFNLGVAEERLGHYTAALEAYAAANARDSTYADPWLNRGFVLLRVHRETEAAAPLERYLVLAPGSPHAAEVRHALDALAARRARHVVPGTPRARSTR